MAANRRTVTPKAGGAGWTVTGGTDAETYPTQAAAQAAAEADLMASGGGEVLVRANTAASASRTPSVVPIRAARRDNRPSGGRGRAAEGKAPAR